MISARWALGYGPETFPLVFPRFQSEELARAYPDFYHESPHNMFLDAAAAQGVPGLVVLAALCVVGFRAAQRARISEPRLAGALAAAFAGGLVSQQFSALILPTALCLYLCAGLLVALADIEHAAARSRWLAVPAVALAAVFCLAAAQIVLYDRALFRVRRNLDAANLDEAVRTWTQARPRPLTGEGADLWYSRKLASAIQPGQNLLPLMAAAASAMEAAVHATRDAADRQNAWYNLAQFQALRNDPAAMEASLRAALECAPNWYKPHWALARLLRQTGRIREASAEAALVLNLGGGRNPEVRRSLEGL